MNCTTWDTSGWANYETWEMALRLNDILDSEDVLRLSAQDTPNNSFAAGNELYEHIEELITDELDSAGVGDQNNGLTRRAVMNGLGQVDWEQLGAKINEEALELRGLRPEPAIT